MDFLVLLVWIIFQRGIAAEMSQGGPAAETEPDEADRLSELQRKARPLRIRPVYGEIMSGALPG